MPAVGASKAVLGEYLLPTIGENETYYRRKRDLLWEEKRPTMGEKETWFLVRWRQYWASTYYLLERKKKKKRDLVFGASEAVLGEYRSHYLQRVSLA